jgi:hypothetical protein
MTTQQQLDSLRSAIDRIEVLTIKIKEALADDDAAEAEVALGELTETLGVVTEALDRVTPDEPPAEPQPTD